MSTENIHIRYLKRQEIDTTRWDQCISLVTNRLVYGFSFYLDHMAAGQWDALVLNDYEAVMPLPWRQKWGIRYAYQPAFTQQLGIFGAAIPPATTDAFLQHLRLNFKFAEIFLNYKNPSPGLMPRVNFILPLDAPYDKLAAQYKKNLVRNLRQAEAAGLNYVRDFDLTTALSSFEQHYASRFPHCRPEDYRNFERLCQLMKDRGQLLTRAATSPQQQLLATAIVFRDADRLYLLQSAALPDGKKTEANHFLLDRLIQEWAGTGLTLDFEGSDQPGIARFYANFSSGDQPYYFLRHNKLPWPVRLLKR